MRQWDYSPRGALPGSFYARDTGLVARELLGRILVRQSSEGTTSGMIVETEAYLQGAPSCHAYRGMTPRNRAMFGPPGRAYIYFTYGMHHCFNVVTSSEGVGEAVLIRALEPLEGIDLMRRRRGRERLAELCSGPARLVRAMGIDPALYGHDLSREPLYIVSGSVVGREEVVVTTRVGIREGAELPLRFYIKGNGFVSRK